MGKKRNIGDKDNSNSKGTQKEEYYISAGIKLYKENKENKKSPTYFKNEEALRKLEEPTSRKDYTETDFKREIKEEVTKFINKKFDNIVFLAGAGTSVVTTKSGEIVSKYGKTMKGIAEIVYDVLDNDKECFNLIELAEKVRYKNEQVKDNNEQVKDNNEQVKDNNEQVKDDKKLLLNKFNLEDFLSSVIHYESYVDDIDKEKYTKTKHKILQTIKSNTIYKYDKKIHKHGALLNILTKKVEAPSKLSIVTTNYDTLFEEAAAEGNYTIFDGFKFLPEPQFDSDIFDWNLVKEVSDIKTRELEYNPKVFNLIKIHGSRTWKRVSESKIIRMTNGEKIPAEKTVMIFPSSEKYAQSYQEPYFDLFTKFQELLKRKNTLLVTAGFSFSDNHIFRMITQAVKNNKEFALLVTDIDIEQPENKNWQYLLDLVDDYHQVAFLKATMNQDLVGYLWGNEQYD